MGTHLLEVSQHVTLDVLHKLRREDPLPFGPRRTSLRRREADTEFGDRLENPGRFHACRLTGLSQFLLFDFCFLLFL